MTRLEAVHPVIGCRNVTASVAFYGRLGFSLTFQDSAENPKYAAVRRDDVELHLQWADESQWAYPVDRGVTRIVVNDVEALFAELRDRGVIDSRSTSPWRSPGDTPWGTREFHVLDPDGNGLQFYRVR